MMPPLMPRYADADTLFFSFEARHAIAPALMFYAYAAVSLR